MVEIVSAYSDGGVIGRNPSLLGGTWAWCHVNASGVRINHASGYVTPESEDMPRITNNYTELLAAVLCLEALPDGWTGQVFTDSLVTLRRVVNPIKAKFSGIPIPLWERLVVSGFRLGIFDIVLLGGHPNRKELAAGVRKDGMPVSSHNVFCDNLCNEQADRFRREHP